PLPTRCAPLYPTFPHLQQFYTQAISTMAPKHQVDTRKFSGETSPNRLFSTPQTSLPSCLQLAHQEQIFLLNQLASRIPRTSWHFAIQKHFPTAAPREVAQGGAKWGLRVGESG